MVIEKTYNLLLSPKSIRVKQIANTTNVTDNSKCKFTLKHGKCNDMKHQYRALQDMLQASVGAHHILYYMSDWKAKQFPLPHLCCKEKSLSFQRTLQSSQCFDRHSLVLRSGKNVETQLFMGNNGQFVHLSS